MTASASAELIAELEAAVRDGSPERRGRMLRRVAELLLADADRLSPLQICVFDDVLIRLMDRMEARTLAEVGTALAEIVRAPQATVRRLADHENPAVAAPVLLRSPFLSDADLAEIANNRGQQHLVAIAMRPGLSEALTEIILKRAGKDALRALARNAAARLSAAGYSTLLATAERDDTVAESLGLRPDLPAVTFEVLISKATETVRARLLNANSPQVRERVKAALARLSAESGETTAASNDYTDACSAMVALGRLGKLNDSTVNRFAMRREYANVIAALSLLSGAAVENIVPLMEQDSGEGLLIACRASGLNWQTTLAVISNRRVRPLSKQALEQSKEVFESLYISAAQYSIRFEPPGRGAAKPKVEDTTLAVAGGRR